MPKLDINLVANIVVAWVVIQIIGKIVGLLG
jgi:hypothetical protein